jgi:anti-sigma-K factor RskA
MNACREWKGQLLEYATLGVSADEAAAGKERDAEAKRLEAHIKGCAGCAAALAELRARAARIDTAIPSLAQGAELREGFEARVFARIAAGEASGNAASLRTYSWGGWRTRLAAAGVVCAVVIAAVVWPQVKKWWHIGEEPAMSISTWRSPTESLLRTPGMELLRSAPKVGEVYFSLQQVSRKVKK